MRRVLISIGCNQYSHIGDLNSAEADARRIFQTMLRRDVGNYDEEHSQLLSSPTLSDVNEAIERCLFSSGKIDAFTFFFAGHGDIRPASFYMCVKDTQMDRLSTTGLSLTDIFLRVSEAQPPQTNVIIDACYSGGLVADLGVILKPDIMGNAGTPSITLLAMSARDQESLENPSGGIGTTALLECINGSAFVQDSTPSLDLSDIGRTISGRISRGVGQAPVVWGLNLHGKSIFCKNPHYKSAADAALQRWSPRSFIDTVEPLLSGQAHDPQA